MALLFMDGFDHLAATSADQGLKYSSVSITNAQLSLVTGRVTGKALRFNGTGSFVQTLRKDLGTSNSVAYVGLAIRAATFGSGAGVNWGVFQILDSGTAQMSLAFNGTGQILIHRGAFSTLLATDTTLLAANHWYFIEFKCTIDPSAGTIDVRVDGSSHISLTGQNTRSTGNSSSNGILVGNLSSIFGGPSVDIDDMYVCNGSAGLGSSGFIGDLRVSTQLSSGNGNYSQFTRTGGTASGNYTAVSENPEDGDTSYVASSTIGNIDTYTNPSLSTSVIAVKGVQFNVVARKDDTAARALAVVQRSTGSDFAGTTLPNLSNSYNDYTQITETSLATATAWTPSEVNTSEFGPKVVT